MDQMFFAGGYLCVGLQRLDRPNFYSPVGTSYLAVIDVATNAVVDMNPNVGGVQPITLSETNPYSEVTLAVFQGRGIAYFSCVGFFGLSDGGVLACDLSDPTQQTTILTETHAGGDVLDVELVSDTRGFAIIATPSFTTELIAFNPTTGLKIGATMYAPGGYDLNDIETSPAGLLLSDRKPTNPGIRCFDVVTNAQLPGGPVSMGLPPFDILVEDGTPSAVGDSPAATHLGSNYPNPFNPETTIPFTLARSGHVTLRIFDVAGHEVATLVDEARPAGHYISRWNGRSARGATAPSGIYFIRLDANGTVDVRKAVLLK
jgi:hypothetical protein